jgi:Flp pilus assembly protein TadG
MIRRLPALACDSRGVAAIEFALLSPVLLLALMGAFDTGYDMYTASLLEGAIQKAARDTTLEKASLKTAAIDDTVTKTVRNLAPAATLTFSRAAYHSFSAIGKPEDFTDTNGNGRCDRNEPYEDVNDNSRWDTDRGDDDIGGARDAVLYTVTVTYPRPFAVASLLGWPSTYTMTAKTVLANQPWDNLAKTVPKRNCT